MIWCHNIRPELPAFSEGQKMKKSFFSILCAMAFFLLFFHLALAQDVKKPRLVLKTPIFDVGEVDEGKVIKHTFTVYNRGDTTLQIKNVRPG